MISTTTQTVTVETVTFETVTLSTTAVTTVGTTTAIATVTQQPSTQTTTVYETATLQASTQTQTVYETVSQLASTSIETVVQTVSQPASTVTQTVMPATVTATAIGPSVTVVTTEFQPTTVTQLVPTTVTATPATAPLATVVVDPAAYLEYPNKFLVTGSVSPGSDIVQIEFYAKENGSERDLGAAALNKDGTFSFEDPIPRNAVQGFITAVATDSSGRRSTTAAPFALFNTPGAPRQEFYDPKTGAYQGDTVFYPNGLPRFEETVAPDRSPLVTSTFAASNQYENTVVHAPGQTVTVTQPATIENNFEGNTSFVFQQYHGDATVEHFLIAGRNHDVLDLPSSDYSSFTDVLNHTKPEGKNSEIHDPVTGDNITLVGVSKRALSLNPDDIKFHK